MRTSGLSDKAFIFALLAGALALAGCDWIKQRSQGEGSRRTETTEKAAGVAKAGAAASSLPPAASGATELSTDIDGDGRVDTVRIARVGHFAVENPIAVKSIDGSITEPAVDWEKDAIIVKLGSGGEFALNFAQVQSLASIRPGSRGQAELQSLGCPTGKQGRGLLAKAEEGSVVMRVEGGRIVAESCGE